MFEDKKQKSNELIESLLDKLNISKDKREEVIKVYFENKKKYLTSHVVYRRREL